MEFRGKSALVVVDPQNDFCDQRGALYVDGAAADIARLARHIARCPGEYDGIFVSLDSHDVIAAFHPGFWMDAAGRHPAPYTRIARGDVADGVWRPVLAEHLAPVCRTFDAMERKNVDFLMVWPVHCVVSTWGHQIADPLREAFRIWREETGRPVRFVFKGENPYTDQFSIFEGVDDGWPETAFNENLFAALSAYESVTFAGEALSHCVAESAASYMERRRGGECGAQAVRLLVDCTSPVEGFDGAVSLERLSALGVAISRTEG